MKFATIIYAAALTVVSVAFAIPSAAPVADFTPEARGHKHGLKWRVHHMKRAFCHLPGQGCRKLKRDEGNIDMDALTAEKNYKESNQTELIYYAELTDLTDAYSLFEDSGHTKRGIPWRYDHINWVFCHLPGQGCRKAKRQAEDVAAVLDTPVEYLTKDDLIEGNADHDMIKRAAATDPEAWWVFCHLPGQGCKKVKRSAEELHDELI